MTTGKTIDLTIWMFVSKVMSLLLNALSWFIIAILPRILLILWLQPPYTLILETKTMKSDTFHFFPSIYLEVVGPDVMIFVFWMLSLKSQFSLSSFTFKRLFGSSSVQFSSFTVMSDSLQPHGLQHTRLPCPSPTPGGYSNSCPLSWWCHPAISSSVVTFSCLQSVPASGSFPVSHFFAWGGQSIGASASASASVLPMNIQGWFPLGWTGLISLQSKGLSRVFTNT